MKSDERGAYNEALYRVSLAINAELDLPQILDKVVNYCRTIVKSDDASIVLWDGKVDIFELGASTTKVGQSVPFRVRLEGGATRWILKHNQPLIMADALESPFLPNPMIVEDDIGAYAGVPIQHKDDIIGVLYVLSLTKRQFDEHSITAMRELASMTAIAVQNAKLVQSLQDLNEFRDVMLQLAAHDLRSPLGLAKGYLEILFNDLEQLSDRQTHWFNIIENSLDRIDELSGSILEYERIAAGIELNKQSHDLNIIAQKVVSDYESLAAEKAHQLILKTASTPLPINGDELLLRQALSNIIANAVKYTPDGGQITAHTARVGDEYVVAVQDSGPGIGSKELSKVFQPFFRLKSTTRSKGSGLGLSLTKMIVERHGGRVMVESVLNEGSVFTMYLPAK